MLLMAFLLRIPLIELHKKMPAARILQGRQLNSMATRR